MKDVNVPALVVFVLFFLLVTAMGFLASRWRRADPGPATGAGAGADTRVGSSSPAQLRASSSRLVTCSEYRATMAGTGAAPCRADQRPI